MLRLAMLTAVAGLLAAPALAASEPSTPAPEAEQERVVCKTTPQLGSRLRKVKSCRTAKEWADVRQQTRTKTEEVQRVWHKEQ